MSLIVGAKLQDLGRDVSDLLDRYGLTPEERVLALMSAAYGEAAIAGMTLGQLKDRMSRVFVECQKAGVRLSDGSPRPPQGKPPA